MNEPYSFNMYAVNYFDWVTAKKLPWGIFKLILLSSLLHVIHIIYRQEQISKLQCMILRKLKRIYFVMFLIIDDVNQAPLVTRSQNQRILIVLDCRGLAN